MRSSDIYTEAKGRISRRLRVYGTENKTKMLLWEK